MRKCYIRQSGVVHFSFKKNVSKIGFKKTNQLYLITIFKCYLLVRLVFSLIMIIIIEFLLLNSWSSYFHNDVILV